MGENSSVEELLVQGHTKVAGDGAQVIGDVCRMMPPPMESTLT